MFLNTIFSASVLFNLHAAGERVFGLVRCSPASLRLRPAASSPRAASHPASATSWHISLVIRLLRPSPMVNGVGRSNGGPDPQGEYHINFIDLKISSG